ncbi:MAG: hypothetical protein OXF22_11430 [Anaerolineaceae bacterium]|nr:hypothetical protein [Anaerolineaceae bacterium]
MTETIAEVHSGLRWVIVVLTLVLFVRLGQGVISGGSQKYGRLERLAMLLYHWLFRVQWAVGLLYLIIIGNWFDAAFLYRWEHLITMTIGLGILELQRARFPGKTDRQRYRHGIIALTAAIVLVFIGVQRLPAGWGI